MSYAKNYNTRQSRYSTSGNGQYGDVSQSPLSSQNSTPSYQAVGVRKQQIAQPPKPQQQPMAPKPPQITPQPKPMQQQAPMQQQNNSNLKTIQMESDDVDMQNAETEEYNNSASNTGETPQRPHWMKSRLAGVKKVSNKERRRRQNENLRRLLTPKNALMVLNEMMPGEQVNNQFKVEPAGATNQMYGGKSGSFCADLTINGNTYKGYGENKIVARNVAAEQAIRDLIIEKMNKALGAEGHDIGDESEEALPMIQLASFALHKLFSEWEYGGHKVPQLKPSNNSVSESGSVEMANTLSSPRAPKPQKKKELPLNAADMHPCMLLTFMRPVLEYKELAVDGDRPQNMVFTMGVEVDGSTYIGKASNKKEARKQAAKAACTALFGVRFSDNPNDNTPKVQA